MTSFTSSTSSFEDEKSSLLIDSNATSASPLNRAFANFRTIVGRSISRAGEWLHGLPSDRGMFVELDVWEKNQDIEGQLTNAFLDHFKGTDIGFIPPAPTVSATAHSTKFPLGHLMKVIDRTLGNTELEKKLGTLTKKMSAWEQSCASESSESEYPQVCGPWETDVEPLLNETFKAINRINREGGQKGAEASTKGREESQCQSQFSKATSDR